MNLIDDQAFQRIMAERVNRNVLSVDEARNQERIENYRKRCAEHRMVTYEHDGEIKYAVGRNETEARQRALIETSGDDYKVLMVGPVEVKA